MLEETRSFTAKYEKIADRLLTPVSIIANRKKIDVDALWDTGATNSCISKEVAKKLKLIPTGREIVSTASGNKKSNIYLVDICLPNSIIVHDVIVCETAIGEQKLGLLVGMDIISLGDFAVSNFAEKTVFSFSYPSTGKIGFEPILNYIDGN